MPALTQVLQSRRLSIIAPYVKGDIVDLGCGHAPLLDRFGPYVRSYCGVDRSPELIEDCRRRHPGRRFECIDLESERLDLGMRFDTVIMLALVEHVCNQRHLFQQARECMKEDGLMVATTPTVLGNDIVHPLGAAIGLFSAQAADDHCVVYNRRRFELIASRVGLVVEDYRRFQLGCNQRVVLARRPGTRREQGS